MIQVTKEVTVPVAQEDLVAPVVPVVLMAPEVLVVVVQVMVPEFHLTPQTIFLEP